MEEMKLFNLSPPDAGGEGVATVTPNLWLLSAEDLPPILFSPEEVARLLHISRHRVFDLIRRRELRSVKVGGSRRISARALSEYVAELDVGDPA